MRKTTHGFDWKVGHYKTRTLSRSFDTLEEAETFSADKKTLDIYKSNGRYKVEWLKTIMEE